MRRGPIRTSGHDGHRENVEADGPRIVGWTFHICLGADTAVHSRRSNAAVANCDMQVHARVIADTGTAP